MPRGQQCRKPTNLHRKGRLRRRYRTGSQLKGVNFNDRPPATSELYYWQPLELLTAIKPVALRERYAFPNKDPEWVEIIPLIA